MQSTLWLEKYYGSKKMITQGIRRTIRTGGHTLVWDPQIPDVQARPPIMPQVYDPNLKVSDLIDPIMNDWDSSKLRSLLDPHDILLVRSLHINRTPIQDGYCQNSSISGNFRSNQGTCLQETEKILKQELVTIAKSSKGENLESFKM